MKKSITFFKATLFLITLMSLVSCNKKEEISVLVNKLWFPEGACVQDLSVTANCKWSISIDDGADWFTIDPMSGRNNETLKVSVKALGELDSRSSSFTITSAKGTVQLKVLVSQNTDEPADLENIANMVFGVASLSHWNVDYFGEVIEETYKQYEFNPYDTATGYLMYFLQDGQGYQKDNHSDSAVYYQFLYDYNPSTRILHLDFATDGESTEIYDAPVLIATEELFRFQHEYKPMRWELADMRKIGTILPQEKTRITKATKKRKPTGGVFQY